MNILLLTTILVCNTNILVNNLLLVLVSVENMLTYGTAVLLKSIIEQHS